MGWDFGNESIKGKTHITRIRRGGGGRNGCNSTAEKDSTPSRLPSSPLRDMELVVLEGPLEKAEEEGRIGLPSPPFLPICLIGRRKKFIAHRGKQIGGETSARESIP